MPLGALERPRAGRATFRAARRPVRRLPASSPWPRVGRAIGPARRDLLLENLPAAEVFKRTALQVGVLVLLGGADVADPHDTWGPVSGSLTKPSCSKCRSKAKTVESMSAPVASPGLARADGSGVERDHPQHEVEARREAEGGGEHERERPRHRPRPGVLGGSGLTCSAGHETACQRAVAAHLLLFGTRKQKAACSALSTIGNRLCPPVGRRPAPPPGSARRRASSRRGR